MTMHYFTGEKCPICGSKLKCVEVTDEERTDETGEWQTKFTDPLCTNHNPWIDFTGAKKAGKYEECIKHYVNEINKGKITIKRKNKWFLENKKRLGITQY